MQQDKNFHIRLRAAVEKRLKQHGLISKYGINPPDKYSGEQKRREWAFIESLDEITFEFLQGEKSDKAHIEVAPGDIFAQKHLDRIRVIEGLQGRRDFYVSCFPGDKGAINLPNGNTWVRPIDINNVKLAIESINLKTDSK